MENLLGSRTEIQGTAFELRRSNNSKFVDDQGDAACEQVAGGLARIDFDEFYGEGPVVGAKDQPVQEEVRIADAKMRARAHGVEVWPVGPIGGDGVVMAIDEHDGFREQKRIHGLRVSCRNADGDEALPGPAGVGDVGLERLQNSGLEMKHGLDSGRANVGLKERGGMGDDWNRVPCGVKREVVGLAEDWKQVVGCEALGGENAVHCIEGKLPAAMKEVGEVGLSEAGLAGEQRNTQRPPLDSAKQLQAKTIVHLGEIHVWKICHQQ